MEGLTRLSPLAGEPSDAALINAITPAVAVAGDAIGSVSALDVAPESLTVTVALPGSAISELDTEAARSVASPNWVGSGAPFQLTTDEAVKPVPFTVSVNGPSPAIAYVIGNGLLAP
jgi:hypothetical protein